MIIGAGPAGLTALRIAMRNKIEVLIIDQGSHFEPDYSPRNSNLRGVDEDTGGIGGTSRIWAGQLIQLTSKDLASGEFDHLFSTPEYKSNANQILKWFKFGKFQNVIFSCAKKLYASYDHPNISLVTKYLKLGEVFSEELTKCEKNFIWKKVDSLSFLAERVKHLVFDDGSKLEIHRNDIIVLAAGTMGNTRILLNSIPDYKDFALGSNLTDHPCGNIGTIYPRFKYGLFKKDILGFTFGNSFKLKYELISKFSEASGCFEIRPNKSKTAMRNYRKSYRDLGFSRFVLQIIIRIVNMIFYKITTFPWVVAESADVWLQFEQVNNLESNVVSNDTDFLYNWHLNNQDLNNFNELQKLIVDQISKRGDSYKMYQIQNIEELNLWAQQANHPAGTISNTKFIGFGGVSNQYSQVLVTGGAILPRASWVNPTLTIMTTTAIGMNRILSKSNF